MEPSDSELDDLLRGMHEPPSDERLEQTWQSIRPKLKRRNRMLILLERTRIACEPLRPAIAAAAVIMLLMVAGALRTGGRAREAASMAPSPGHVDILTAEVEESVDWGEDAYLYDEEKDEAYDTPARPSASSPDEWAIKDGAQLAYSDAIFSARRSSVRGVPLLSDLPVLEQSGSGTYRTAGDKLEQKKRSRESRERAGGEKEKLPAVHDHKVRGLEYTWEEESQRESSLGWIQDSSGEKTGGSPPKPDPASTDGTDEVAAKDSESGDVVPGVGRSTGEELYRFAESEEVGQDNPKVTKTWQNWDSVPLLPGMDPAERTGTPAPRDRPAGIVPFTQQPGNGPVEMKQNASPRKVIKTAQISLEVDAFAKASASVDATVRRWGGFYADSQITQHDNGTTSGMIVIRVPQQNFEALYAELKKLGRILSENAKGDDVTAQYTDIKSRIRNAEHMERRLLAILAEKRAKDKMSDVLEVEREIGRVRESIETMVGQIRSMDDRVSLGTIHLKLAEPPRIVPSATLAVEVENVTEATTALEAVIAPIEATVAARNVSRGEQGSERLTLTLRVPMAQFGVLLESLTDLGRVSSRTVNGYQPALIAKDPGAKDVKATVSLSLVEPSRQQPGGHATLEVETLTGAATALANALQAAGGEQMTHQETNSNGTASATYQVRVPRGNFAHFVRTLPNVGRVVSQQIVGADALAVPERLADIPCTVNLTFNERNLNAPSANVTVASRDLAATDAALAELLAQVEGHVYSHHETRTANGQSGVSYVLRCRRSRYNALLAGLDTLGRITAKEAQNLDLRPVRGAAADQLCSLSLQVTEHRAPVPGAVFEIVVEDAEAAAKALGALRDSCKAETLSSHTSQNANGTVRQEWRVHVPVKQFVNFLGGLDKVGRIRNKQVSDIGSGADEQPDPDAMARIALTLVQERPLALSHDEGAGSLMQALGAGRRIFVKTLALTVMGIVVVAPWLLVIFILTMIWRRFRGKRMPGAEAPEATNEDN